MSNGLARLPSVEDVRAELRRRAAARERENGRWKPRAYQQPLWAYLMGGGLRADVVAHRRWGKDDVALNWANEARKRRVGTFWHMLPEASQARKAIWDAINPHTGRKRIDEAFPVEERRRTRNTDMFIEFENGSTWQVVGSDSFDSLVGAPPVGVVFSEWALAKPEAWTYLRPILAENGGWAVFIWTPRGRNHAVRAFETREANGTWFTLRSPANKTDVFTPEQLARERQELIDEYGSEEEGDSKYRQEYLVDFDAKVPGAYFGTKIQQAQDEGRLGAFGPVASMPVDTAWDLGVDDYTAIWFFQDNGKRVRVVDYFEATGQGAPEIVRAAMPELMVEPDDVLEGLAELARAKPYKYRNHYLPHDVMVREWGGGARSRYETLVELGLKPGQLHVGKQRNPAERINAVRRLLPVVSFNTANPRVLAGLDRLRQYRRRFNRVLQVYGEPLHDENSHAADAMGEYAVNSPLAVYRKPDAAAAPRDRWDSDEEEEGSWKVR